LGRHGAYRINANNGESDIGPFEAAADAQDGCAEAIESMLLEDVERGLEDVAMNRTRDAREAIRALKKRAQTL
jgi:hypothetical protein